MNISGLVEFFNDGLETFFLSDKEKRLLAKMVFALREYKELIYSERVFDEIGECSKYKMVSGHEVNPTNSPDSYFLLQPLKGNKAVVISGGKFDQEVTKKLLLNLRIKKESLQYISKCIHQISLLTNEWISFTDNYFVANPNLFNSKKHDTYNAVPIEKAFTLERLYGIFYNVSLNIDVLLTDLAKKLTILIRCKINSL
ncbi:hypothetical protein [Bacillus altitudinis]|uniref:hypothetical protein n=1 Tax=Bacillus altitudinis TaxID=293387 RepID=UPI003F569261